MTSPNKISPLLTTHHWDDITLIPDIKTHLAINGFVGIQMEGPQLKTATELAIQFDLWRFELESKHVGKEIYKPHGVIGGYGVGCAPFMWKARDWVRPLFENFWGTTNLRCSLDGANYSEYRKYANKAEAWLHRDQGFQSNDFEMIQGVLDFGNSGNLVVVRGSHQDDIGQYSATGQKCGFFKIPEDLRYSAILEDCISDGPTLWLWDSRTWHANAPPQMGGFRKSLYVTFGPAKEFNESEKLKRWLFVQGGETTSHWPNRLCKNGPVNVRPAYRDRYLPADAEGETEVPEHAWAY